MGVAARYLNDKEPNHRTILRDAIIIGVASPAAHDVWP